MCVAFGQGTGPIFVTLEVLQAARQQYYALVQANLDTWDTNALALTDYARALGRTAAALAALNGEGAITGDRYTQSSALVANKGGCPYCLVSAD
jgi:hypothetical protein